MAGTFAGAKLGATLGSFFGPVGTLAGGAVGSIAGTMLGEEGFEYIIPSETTNIIALVSEQVGAPTYIKPPIFIKHNSKKRFNQ